MIRPRLPVPPAPKRAEQDWAPWLRRTRPSLRASARNLVHYWALRQHDLQDLQQTLSAYGLRVEAAGLCHTDIHAARGEWPVKPKLPLIPGHEGVGIVEEVGPTEVSGIAVGDRVAVPWLGYACGQYRYCNDGRETLCARQLRTGYTIDGSYADFVLGYARHVVTVPDGVDPFDAAPLTCAG